MIQGVGIDVVDIERFRESLDRTPGLLERLFTPAERDLPVASLAARFAAKEALAKALGAPMGLHWHDAEVIKADSGAPSFLLRDSVALAVNGANVHLSLSHDAGIASAVVMVERG
ncbi:holo-[acyl-carrier-protein] synthase [mine drainage metagenome]|uniref:Holo-[acyl-carrier-protein] synthase n=1 Tax=mine drainage metagenome TaxID=410659 RepID=A0A1J5Q9T3_9ZZZZ